MSNLWAYLFSSKPRRSLKFLIIIGAIVILLANAGMALAATIPTTSILSVVKDQSVTVRTYNFPAHQTFTVRIGPWGTQGINGTVVGTTDSGAGGSFDVTYNIPANLKGSSKLSIRLESSQGYFAYDWFYNTDGNVASSTAYTSTPTANITANNESAAAATSTPVPSSYHSGLPSTSIISVSKDSAVTIRATNFPNQTFTVRMGAWGTQGINGTVVGSTTFSSTAAADLTYNIPDNLKGSSRIAIRLESPQGFYAYDWFNNADGNWSTTSSTTTANNESSSSSTSTPTAAVNYSGYPSTSIVSVSKDASVTVRAVNFPANQTYTVRMGAWGTRGVNGTVVGTTTFSSTAAVDLTYTIPDNLKGSSRIAIRLESPSYYAYDWFNNN